MAITHQSYSVSEHFGFILRQVSQRYAAHFAAAFGDDLTSPQFSTLVTLLNTGPCSQNQLGRLVATDAATIKGIVDRLLKRGMVVTSTDPADGRMLIISLTKTGRAAAETSIDIVRNLNKDFLGSLTADEQERLLDLLRRLR
jgi:DNA-binding MarR family transcriptional regulator